MQICHIPFHLTYTITQNPVEFLSKILTQIAGVPKLLDAAKILQKSSTL